MNAEAYSFTAPNNAIKEGDPLLSIKYVHIILQTIALRLLRTLKNLLKHDHFCVSKLSNIFIPFSLIKIQEVRLFRRVIRCLSSNMANDRL
jgi:hypothetical protein